MPFPPDFPEKLSAMAMSLGVRQEDVSEKFVRGSGHGGQKINRTSSCVELFHAPTGIAVRVQKHREQHLNRLSAWKLLLLKIEEKVKGAESEIAREKYKKRKQKERRSRRAQEKVLQQKKERGELKQSRQKIL